LFYFSISYFYMNAMNAPYVHSEGGLAGLLRLIEAGEARLRPYSCAAIAMAHGAGSEWKNGLAIVMIGGLLSSLCSPYL
jgi:HAE1 family hydrophobic/amphiphilic exporter-1